MGNLATNISKNSYELIRAYRNKQQFLTQRQKSSNVLALSFLLSAVAAAGSVTFGSFAVYAGHLPGGSGVLHLPQVSHDGEHRTGQLVIVCLM